jgi:hypothetical protein
MGGSQGKVDASVMEGRKKVVIIGASFGGKIMTNMLQ